MTHILGPTIVFGLGIGICVVPVADGATAAIDPELAGLASGLVNTARQLGGALGVAVAVTPISAGHHSADVVDGYNTALLACAAISLPAVLLALFMPGPVVRRSR